VQLAKSGNNHKGLCPFHNEATPSFLVSEDKGIYKCFGCGEGGDAISFLSKMENISFTQALTQLAQHSGVDQNIINQINLSQSKDNFDKEIELLTFIKGFYKYYLLNSEEGKIGLDYLENRGITKNNIEYFGIGLAPKDGNILIKALEANSFSFELAKKTGILGQRDDGAYYSLFRSRIIFSIDDEQGRTVGFSGRTYLPDDKNQAKYVNSPESNVFQKSKIVYNLNEAKKAARQSKKLMLFEGFLDVISSVTAGFSESVATMGTSLTANHAQIIKRHANEVVLVFDGDKAGLSATAKAVMLLLPTGIRVKVVIIPNGLDPDDFIKQNGIRKFADLIENATGAMDFQYEFLKQGLMLETTDAQVEFERRLNSFASHLPNQSMQKALLRKWKDELYQKNRKSSQNFNAAPSLRNTNQQKSPLPPLSVLKVTSREVKAEKELIFYMMLDKKVFDLTSKLIGTAFNIDAYRKIAQAIEAYYYKNEIMDKDKFLAKLEPVIRQTVEQIAGELRNRPKKWSEEMIVELTEVVQNGAFKLERAGKKEMFYKANHQQQLMMMSDLTTGLVN